MMDQSESQVNTTFWERDYLHPRLIMSWKKLGPIKASLINAFINPGQQNQL